MTPAVRARMTVARPQLMALAVRLSILPLVAVAVVLVPHPNFGLVGLAAIGVLLAITLPANAGAGVALTAVVLTWAVSYGTDSTPPFLRTALFAVVVYLVHAATALAASVPVAANLQLDVVAAWAIRCVPGVVAAIVVAGVVSTLGHPHGSIGLDIAGLLSVLVTAAALMWLTRSRR